MDRLTIKKYHKNKGYYVLKCFESCEGFCSLRDEGFSLCGVQVAVNKLAAYEDTGLSPDEVNAMKAEYSDTFQAHLQQLCDIKDKRVVALEVENAQLKKLLGEIEDTLKGV